MGRTLKTDIPGTDWRRSFEQVAELGLSGLFQPEFEAAGKRVVEIGFGRGEFLLRMAEERPECAFLGVELSYKRVTKMARRLARMPLQNVRLYEGRAEPLVAEALADASVDEFWINFPDPWPKKRHAERRLIQPLLVAGLARRLVPGGILQLTTDHPAYAEQMHEVLSKEVGLENRLAPAPWLPEVEGRSRTAYELEWRAEGRSLHFFTYARLPR